MHNDGLVGVGVGVRSGVGRVARAFAPEAQERRQRFEIGPVLLAERVGHRLVLGADRIMLSADWPFENIDHAAAWFDVCPISEADRRKIGRDNARKLFKLAK